MLILIMVQKAWLIGISWDCEVLIMLNVLRKFLYYWLLIISLISLINIIVLYWFPIHIPLSSYVATSLMSIVYFFKAYYLVPIALLICVFVFCGAFSFRKKRIVLPVMLLVYFLIDSFFPAYSFFNAWFNDEYFIAMQAIKIIINLVTIVVIFIYIFKRKNQSVDGSKQLKKSD